MRWEELDWQILDRLRAGFLHEGLARAGDYWRSRADLENYDFTFAQRIAWKWRAVLREVAIKIGEPSRLRARHLVDFGCGTGRNLIPLAEQGWRVVGVDLSSDMLEEYRTKASLVAQSEAVAIRANMAHLDCLADGFADTVLCM